MMESVPAGAGSAAPGAGAAGATPSRPRVNGEMLGSFVGAEVSLVGRVEQVDGTNATLQAADGAKVVVHLQKTTTLSSTFVEIIGRVNSDGTVDEQRSVSFGDKFDLKNYNELVKLTHGKFAGLFKA